MSESTSTSTTMPSWTVDASEEILDELEQYGYEQPIILCPQDLLRMGEVLSELSIDMGGCNPEALIDGKYLRIKRGGF